MHCQVRGVLKVFVASDFHGNAKAFHEAASKVEGSNADIIVLCGDITHFGSVQEAKTLLSPLVKLQLPTLFVPGNCDPPSLIELDIDGAHCIHGTCEIYEDMAFIGVGGGLISPFQTVFEMTEKQIMDVLTQGFKKAQKRRWMVLVSHNPPKNTKLDMLYADGHVGSVSVRQFIEERKPSIVFCGHIHEARGVDQIGDTVLVNPGPARHGHCALADFNGKIEVKLEYL